MEFIVYAFLFLLGVSVGSFVNVVVLRFGFTERPSTRSQCASCTRTLQPQDLLPIVSYLWLKGRCRLCGSRIHPQYPAVELLVGVLFVLTYFTISPSDTLGFVVFLGYLGFWSAFVALLAYDMRHTLIPLPFVYALWAFAAITTVARTVSVGMAVPFVSGISGVVVVGGFFALISILTRGRGMGIGDAYIAGAIGLILGLSSGIVAAVLAVWIGAIVGLCLLALQRVVLINRLLRVLGHVTLRTEIPFAPFLAIGAVVAFATGIMPLDLGFWVNPY
jgi:prepilin signal peptidase PulO-like enzyme (type II secretory pathway)